MPLFDFSTLEKKKEEEQKEEPQPEPVTPKPKKVPKIKEQPQEESVEEMPEVTLSQKRLNRLKEIYSTQKPKDSKNRKQGSDWYLKTLLLDAQQLFYDTFGNKTIQIHY